MAASNRCQAKGHVGEKQELFNLVTFDVSCVAQLCHGNESDQSSVDAVN